LNKLEELKSKLIKEWWLWMIHYKNILML
jgi:hypothetical protein